MGGLWKLEAGGPFAALLAAAKRLDGSDPAPALSWSVFERDDDPAQGRLEILTETMKQAEALIAGLGLDGEGIDARVAPLAEQDWVRLSQRALPPVQAGRFVVHGGHDAAPDDGRIAIQIEAGPAFGTGHHGTTKGCLLAFSAMLDAGEQPRSILDLGCGAGTLAIAAALALPAAHVMASDIDADAVEEANRNANLNGASHVQCLVAGGLAHPAFKDVRFDLVFANILAGPLVDLAPVVAGALKPGGAAILSGLMTGQQGEVGRAYEAEGLSIERREPLDGWETLLARKGRG